MITFDTIWAIFKPKTYLYRYDELTEQFMVVLLDQVKKGHNEAGVPVIHAYLSSISDDGNSFGIIQNGILIAEQFEGARRIQDLPIYPLAYHNDPEGVRQKAIERGRKFVEMNRKPCEYLEVKGAAMREVSEMGKTRQIKFNASITFHSDVSINDIVTGLWAGHD